MTLNKVPHLESYALPSVDDLFLALSGSTIFTKLDLSQPYLKIKIEKTNKKYLTINTHKDLFQFYRLPFGVSSSTVIFKRMMDNLLHKEEGVAVYLHDIMVTGSDDAVH